MPRCPRLPFALLALALLAIPVYGQARATATGMFCALSPVAALTPAALSATPSVRSATCTANEQCGKDDFCAKLFGACDKGGRCEPRPQDRSERGHMIVKPVCGCDGKSYDDYCLAGAAGVNVKSEGRCPQAPGGGQGK